MTFMWCHQLKLNIYTLLKTPQLKQWDISTPLSHRARWIHGHTKLYCSRISCHGLFSLKLFFFLWEGRVSHHIETICSIRVLHHNLITRWTNFCMFPWQADHGAAVIFQKRSWWRHQMETFSALLALCAGNSPVTDEFPAQRPMTRSFGVFFDLCINNLLSKQSWGWWFETPSVSLWRHCNEKCIILVLSVWKRVI